MSEADSTNLLQIAKVLKSNGTDGGLLLGFRDISPEDIDLSEPVFIEFDGLPVPFFVESFARKGTTKAVAQLTGIHTLQDAEEVVGQAVYVEESTLAFEEDDEMSLEAFIGWTISGPDGVKIGDVTDFEDIPGNPCLYVRKVSSMDEVLVPLHQDLILSIDPDYQVISMALPEGLV